MKLFRNLIFTLLLVNFFYQPVFSQDTVRYLNREYRDTNKVAAQYVVSLFFTDSIPDSKWVYPNSKRWEKGPFSFKDTAKYGYWQYYSDSSTITKEGRYVKDSLEGPWKYYHPTGEICGKVMFDDNDVVEAQYFDLEGNPVSDDEANHFAMFPGGQNALFNFISQNIHYPNRARNRGWQGKVYVQFIVNDTGKISNVKIFKSSGHKIIDKEALRVILAMPFWKPAKMHNQKVNMRYQVPINFKLTGRRPKKNNANRWEPPR